jgi:ribonuclease HI
LNDLNEAPPEPDWDYLVSSDGAGSTLGTSGGWYSVIADKQGNVVKELYGGLSNASNNVAELAPIVFALYYLQALHSPANGTRPRVLIRSDSQITVYCGEGRYERKANLFLWASIDYFQQNVFHLEWQWSRRNSNEALEKADKVAKHIRALLKAPLSI